MNTKSFTIKKDSVIDENTCICGEKLKRFKIHVPNLLKNEVETFIKVLCEQCDLSRIPYKIEGC